jgi:hypothetical protein
LWQALKITRFEQLLGAVADTKDVDSVSAHLEEDAVHTSPPAVEELAQLPGIPLAFRSESTALGVGFERANSSDDLGVPAASSGARPFGKPSQRPIYFAQSSGGDVDRQGH